MWFSFTRSYDERLILRLHGILQVRFSSRNAPSASLLSLYNIHTYKIGIYPSLSHIISHNAEFEDGPGKTDVPDGKPVTVVARHDILKITWQRRNIYRAAQLVECQDEFGLLLRSEEVRQ
jgi:hypothetical protein